MISIDHRWMNDEWIDGWVNVESIGGWREGEVQ